MQNQTPARPELPDPNREEALFHGALALPADQRSAYVQQACGGDSELRRRIDLLLQSNDRAAEFLQPAGSAGEGPTRVVAEPATEKAGDFIGPYKIREKLGEGGCGAVYVAEQIRPVRRRVALKVIKLGMDTRNIIARF